MADTRTTRKTSGLISYGKQSIDDDDIKAVTDVLRSDWLTQGPKVSEFENILAGYCGAKYAVVFSNGTAALHAAYYASGLKSGDDFITTPNTFSATVNAGVFLGARPVFVDIELDTGNINVKLIERKITKKTKLIVPVDYAGQPVDIDEIKKIAKKHKLIVIEDACHALGASYKNKKIGSLADMTVFSFHPVKPITTGEGGAVLTNNKKFYDKLQLIRTHGLKRKSRWTADMLDLGYNFRLTDIQCALGISQMKKLDKFTEKRTKIARKYNSELTNLVDKPSLKADRTSSWHLYAIKIPKKMIRKREKILEILLGHGIAVQIHYIPVYWHKYYAKKYKKGICPKAEEFYLREISIPIYPSLKEEEQAYVIKTINKIIKNENL